MVGVTFKSAGRTFEFRLRWSVCSVYASTMTACLTGILRWNKQQSSAKPCQLVGKLPPELKPALIQYGLVQSRFYTHIFPRMVKLIDVVALCRKSLRTLAILRCRRWILALSFRQLAENFTRFANFRCSFASFFSCFLKLCSGLMQEPSESVAKRATPISTPTAVCEGCTGSGTSRSV